MIARMRKAFAKGSIFKFILLAMFAALTLTACDINSLGMLNPKGLIADQEKKLFFDTLALMLIVVLPVIIMSFTFAYHYQKSHRITDYKPNWSHSYFLETIWWGIPCIIILILGIMTWKKTHELDPYNQIAGQTKAPLVIQAIALPWKWLFIYPDQQIASLNYVVLPLNEPVEFLITADNVAMSALFIPQLGSQIYAMAGMQTKLNLLATEVGVYDGMNTQFNGEGFSDMHFEAHVVTPDAMQQWFAEIKQSPEHLSKETYGKLLDPSIGDKPKFYSDASKDIFSQAIMVYMNTFGVTHPRENQFKLINKE